MIEQCAKLVWKATSAVTPAQIPQLVNEVAKHGGVFLIYQGRYISVESATRHLKFMEGHLQEASEHFSKHTQVSSETEQYIHRIRMTDAARRAGRYFRQYVSDLDVAYHSPVWPQIPAFIEADSELHSAWKSGYSMMESQLNRDSY